MNDVDIQEFVGLSSEERWKVLAEVKQAERAAKAAEEAELNGQMSALAAELRSKLSSRDHAAAQAIESQMDKLNVRLHHIRNG